MDDLTQTTPENSNTEVTMLPEEVATVPPAPPWAVEPAPFPVTDPLVPEVVDGAISTPPAPDVLTVKEVKADTVTVTVPVAFDLTVDANVVIIVKPGVQEMNIEHANHWYAIANGVVIYEPKTSE